MGRPLYRFAANLLVGYDELAPVCIGEDDLFSGGFNGEGGIFPSKFTDCA